MSEQGNYFEAPCEENPKTDDDDVCVWCGAKPEQACQWKKERERE